MIANIETAECWRYFSVTAESPRVPLMTLSVFLSVLRDQVGKNFPLKQVKYEWRKTCLEFQKRIDPDFPFYYFTAHHDRFYEGPRPGFNEPHIQTHIEQDEHLEERGYYSPVDEQLFLLGALSNSELSFTICLLSCHLFLTSQYKFQNIHMFDPR